MTTVWTSHSHRNIADFPVRGGRPLIVCDADEVLFHLVEGLERFLLRNGLWLDLVSYRLTGNIKEQGTNRILEQEDVSALLERFFAEDTMNLDPVTGAADGLALLADAYQVVILTNLPEAYGAARAECLAGHNMLYPVITNSGLKGQTVQTLSDMADARTVFVDDTPPHLTSVKNEAGHVHRIHFVADQRLAKLLGPADDAHFHGTDWQPTTQYILNYLDEV